MRNSAKLPFQSLTRRQPLIIATVRLSGQMYSNRQEGGRRRIGQLRHNHAPLLSMVDGKPTANNVKKNSEGKEHKRNSNLKMIKVKDEDSDEDRPAFKSIPMELTNTEILASPKTSDIDESLQEANDSSDNESSRNDIRPSGFGHKTSIRTNSSSATLSSLRKSPKAKDADKTKVGSSTATVEQRSRTFAEEQPSIVLKAGPLGNLFGRPRNKKKAYGQASQSLPKGSYGNPITKKSASQNSSKSHDTGKIRSVQPVLLLTTEQLQIYLTMRRAGIPVSNLCLAWMMSSNHQTRRFD